MYRRLSIALAVLLLGPALPPAWAQQTADQVVEAARKLYSEQGPRVALPEFERALELYRQEKNQRGEAIVLGLIGNCHKRFGDYPRALEFLHRALALKQELGDRLEEGKTLSHLGLVFWEMGEYAQAIEHLTRSIAIGREVRDRQLEASALNNLSLVYDEQGDYRQSLEQYHRALELYRDTDFPRGEGDTLGNIGGVHLLLGQYREALRYYQQALAISQRLNLKPSASQDLGNIAICYLGLGQMEEALSALERALVLAHDAGLRKEEADWHKAKGSVLLRMGRYAAALDEHRLALDAYEQAGLKRELVEALGDRGRVHVVLGDAATAEKDFRRAIEISRSIGHPRGVTTHLVTLGNLESRRQRYEQAAALYREAQTQARTADDQATLAASSIELALVLRLQNRLDEAQSEARLALETARATGARPAEAEAWYARAEVERAQQRPQVALETYVEAEKLSAAMGDPELGWRIAYGQGQALESLGRDGEAGFAYKRAVAFIESVGAQLREERFRSGYLEDKYQVYVALVRLLLRLARNDEAFQFAEKLRARSYLDLLNGGPAPPPSDAGRARENELRGRIRRLQRAIEDERARPQPEQRAQAMAIFSTELAEAERAYQNLLDDLRSSQPEYVATLTLAVPSTDEIRQRLPADTALVEYVVADEHLSIFVLTRGALQALTIPLSAADLRAKVELLRDLIVRTNSADWRPPAASLRRLLIAPLEEAGWLKGIRRLYLVPHRILHYLPFAALPRQDSAETRFLADDYVLAVLPAASALVYGNGRLKQERHLLALAPARARLVYAQQEARGVARFFPPQRLVMTGTRATENAFKRHAGRYQVLHLATHGYFNKFAPLLSGVELEPDRHDDGRLEVHEILGMRLEADLVTLSACETALGTGYFAEIPAGDDFVGLTRAFLFAGSPSVLATLWEVNDRSTMRLMQGFYRGMAQGDKAAALARAQREMRTGPRYRHPYYWAPFVLVGRME